MSGRRLALGAFVVLIAVTAIAAGSILTNSGQRGHDVAHSWFDELRSVTGDIADSDAEDRRLVWRIGWQVFKDHPVTGVGPGSWSAYASENYTGPVLGERFSQRPERLWGHAMHNIYMQTLAELGLVGFGLFMVLLADYWRRILAMRASVSDSDTSVLPGLRTRSIVLGFEVSMVTVLGAGLLYNVVNDQFFALLIANALFHRAWASRYAGKRSGLRRRRGLAPTT